MITKNIINIKINRNKKTKITNQQYTADQDLKQKNMITKKHVYVG